LKFVFLYNRYFIAPFNYSTKKMSFSNPHQISYCSITYEDFKNGDFVTYLPCKHFYDPTAIANWISNNNTCPLCRMEVTDADLISKVFYKKPDSAPSAPPVSAPLASAPLASAPPVEKSKYVICPKCNKSKYRNNFKGHDRNFKCGGCRKKMIIVNIDNDHIDNDHIDNDLAMVMAYSLIHY